MRSEVRWWRGCAPIALAIALTLAGCGGGDPLARVGALQEEAMALAAATVSEHHENVGAALEAFVADHRSELEAARDALARLTERPSDAADRVMAEAVTRRDHVFARWSELVRAHPALMQDQRALRAMRMLLQ